MGFISLVIYLSFSRYQTFHLAEPRLTSSRYTFGYCAASRTMVAAKMVPHKAKELERQTTPESLCKGRKSTA